VTLPAGSAPSAAIGFGTLGGSFTSVDPAHPLPVTRSPQESVALASANVAASPATLYGGDYIAAQTCSGYGTIAWQVRGPDGATYQTILSRTMPDTAGGAEIKLGSNAVVRVVLTGTTGCNALLTRVP
jgi:hypothetical protein